MKEKDNEKFNDILNTYNEMQLQEMAGHTATLAFTMSTYFKQLCELGTDAETARQLVVAFQGYVAQMADKDMEIINLRSEIERLKAERTWQPIETAPERERVQILIQVINGYRVEVGCRINLGKIGDQWNTDRGTYIHRDGLKMIVGWQHLTQPPEEE